MLKIKDDVELIMLDKHNMKPLIDYINELQGYKERIEKALHLITHSDITDYRVFDEELINILRGEDND